MRLIWICFIDNLMSAWIFTLGKKSLSEKWLSIFVVVHFQDILIIILISHLYKRFLSSCSSNFLNRSIAETPCSKALWIPSLSTYCLSSKEVLEVPLLICFYWFSMFLLISFFDCTFCNVLICSLWVLVEFESGSCFF